MDAIGAQAGTAIDRRAPLVDAAAPPAVASAVAQDAPAHAGSSTSVVAAVASQLAAQPPVDADKVARLRDAVASGSYKIDPATLADRMIALQQEWNSHDPS
jgi:negative regulator of flagellin synthesis FlgM